MSQKELGSRIRMSEPSLSNIMTGKAKPRQVNLLRIIQELCQTPEEEQRLLAAYDVAEPYLPDRPEDPESPTPPDEIERVRRYLEVKADSVRFNEEVRQVIVESGFSFIPNHIQDNLITDFFIPEEGIAVECKFNVNRDWDREVTSVSLLKEDSRITRVIVAVPTINILAQQARAAIEGQGGLLCLLSELGSLLSSLRDGGAA